MDLLEIALDTVLRLFPVIIILVIVYTVFGWRHTSKQSKLQRQETYLPYIQMPESLPVEIFTHPKVYYQIVILFLLVGGIIDTSFYYSYGQEVIKPLMIASAVILFAVVFLIIEYRRNDKNHSHYILTEKSVIYRERCYTYFDNFEIPYNEIESIMHVCSRESYYKYTLTRIKKSHIKYYRYYHYIIIQGCKQRIVINMSFVNGKNLWKIINTCLYFNPNIIIDKTVKDILVHKRIPLLFNTVTNGEREYQN